MNDDAADKVIAVLLGGVVFLLALAGALLPIVVTTAVVVWTLRLMGVQV